MCEGLCIVDCTCVCVSIWQLLTSSAKKRITGTEMCQQGTGDFQPLPDLLTPTTHSEWV